MSAGAEGREGVASLVAEVSMPAKVRRLVASMSVVVSLAQAASVAAWEGESRLTFSVGTGSAGGRRVARLLPLVLVLLEAGVKEPRMGPPEVPVAEVPRAAKRVSAQDPRVTRLPLRALALRDCAAARRAAVAAAEGET